MHARMQPQRGTGAAAASTSRPTHHPSRAHPKRRRLTSAAAASASRDDAAAAPAAATPPRPSAAAAAAPTAPTPAATLFVCTNRTCKKQGSEGIHRFAVDLALPGLEVVTSGCLARCGAGPNVALQSAPLAPSSAAAAASSASSSLASSADDPEVFRHVATPAALVALLKSRWRPPPAASGSDRWPAPLSERHLAAVRARLAGNAAAVEGDTGEALRRYGEALAAIGGGENDAAAEEEEDPPAALGAHLVRSNISAALLQSGRAEEAAGAARRAERAAPREFCTATIRLVDALYALGRFEEAGEAAREGLERHPALRERAEWRDIKGALGQKGERV